MAEKREEFYNYLRTAVDLATHFSLAVLLAWFYYWLTDGWVWPVLAFFGGVLIDLDHFFDYFKYFGMKLDLKDFFGHKQLASGKLYVILHSWEIVLILWICSFWVPWILPLVTGMTVHLAVDHFVFHHMDPMLYLLTYRWYHHFSFREMSPKAYMEWARRHKNGS